MKKITIITLIFVLFSNNQLLAELTAKNVVIKCWENYRYQGTEQTEIETKTITKENVTIERSFIYWINFINNDYENFEDITVTKLIYPKEKEGLAIRTQRTGEENIIEIKRKSQSNLRRISSKRQGSYFSDTAIEEEDFSKFTGENINQFKWSISKKDKSYYIIEAIPLTDTDTAYEKRIFWIDKISFHILMIEYYKNGMISKTQKNTGISFVNNKWRVDKAIFEDIIVGTTTLLIKNRVMNNNLPEKIFKRGFLLE